MITGEEIKLVEDRYLIDAYRQWMYSTDGEEQAAWEMVMEELLRRGFLIQDERGLLTELF